MDTTSREVRVIKPGQVWKAVAAESDAKHDGPIEYRICRVSTAVIKAIPVWEGNEPRSDEPMRYLPSNLLPELWDYYSCEG